MKIIPPSVTFEQALRAGYTGRIECPRYIAWIKTLPCDTCGAPPPSDPSHLDNGFKGTGTKAPDTLTIPQCRQCHETFERNGSKADVIPRMARAALYLTQAVFEGVLVVVKI
jgi:hypothetical protein